MTKVRWRFKIQRNWENGWIGFQKRQPELLIQPIPFVTLVLVKEEVAICPKCGNKGIKVAVNTGDGWALEWDCDTKECPNEMTEIAVIDWPFGDRWVNSKDLRELGYEVA